MKYVIVNKDGGKTPSADCARRLEILEVRRQSPRSEPGGQSLFTDAVGIVGRKPASAAVTRRLAERALRGAGVLSADGMGAGGRVGSALG